MIIRLLTANSVEYQPLADLTLPSKLAFCKRWGHTLTTLKHDPDRFPWERPQMWLAELNKEDCHYLFFTGSDAGISNLEVDLNQLLFENRHPDFLFAVDNNGLQSDSWLMRNCSASRDFLQKVIASEGQLNNEQDAMQIILSCTADYGELRRLYDQAGEDRMQFFQREMNRTALRCRVLPRELINAMPQEHYGGTGKELYSWNPGTLVVHMPGKSLEYRLEHLSPYLAK